MKKTLTFALILLGSITAMAGLAGCQTAKTAETEPVAVTGPDWEGVYTGMIPAADVPGIGVTLTLRGDYTFDLQYEYTDSPESDFTRTGTFEWDEERGLITLDAGDDVPSFYKPGQNVLLQLDMEGNEITGDLAENYILRKEE